LFYGLYQCFVPKDQLRILSVEDQRFVTRDTVADRLRASPLRDITDAPLPELTPKGWLVREPVYFIELHPVGPGSEGKAPTRRVFHLVRDTPVEWIEYQPSIFTFGVVKREDGGAACILDLWETLVVAVAAPWPDRRGPMRRGKKNPFSRERLEEH
jgi:hypothetical protein